MGKPSGTESKPTGSKRISLWSGETIELHQFNGSLREYEEHLGFLRTSLSFVEYGEDCEWKLVPRMIVSQHKENLRFKAAGIIRPLGDRVFNIKDSVKRGQCGQAEEFFKEYLK